MSDVIENMGAIADLAAMPDAIRRLVAAVDTLENSGLKRRALVLLLADMTKLSKKQINAVLDALPLLAERFLEPPQ